MYLANIKLWNFRKYGSSELNLEEPNLDLNFNKNLNVLIGENDSGKTAIIDAIKLVLRTHSYEWIRVTDDDFYLNSNRFRIELIFKGFDIEEAKYFTEWLSLEGDEEKNKPYLRVIYDVSRTSERILPADIRGGNDDDGFPLSAEARYYLRTTYLKPLRDAQSELIQKRYSRLSQILQGHDIFKDEKGNYLYDEFKKFNKSIKEFFEINANQYEYKESDLTRKNQGVKIKNIIDNYIKGFYDKESKTHFKTSDPNLKSILESLELTIDGSQNPGLGTLNRLFMAIELLHLNKDNWYGLRLGLIEELEAHLHPQVQMKVIDTLQMQKKVQLIITTHSPNLASKIKLNNLIVCKDNNTFPMGSEYTELEKDDYIFLEKFLDVTKSNLFFAKGVILVEGWSEEILLSTLAIKVGKDLTENEISLINIGNVGFYHYYRIFLRQKEPGFKTPVSIINDVDIPVYKKISKDNYQKIVKEEKEYLEKCKDVIESKKDKIKYYKSQTGKMIEQEIIEAHISPEWTLEWCLYKSKTLGQMFKEVVMEIHSGSDWSNFEEELAKKLITSSLYKTEISYRLVNRIEEKFDNDKLEIEQTDTIYYLIEAIDHVL